MFTPYLRNVEMAWNISSGWIVSCQSSIGDLWQCLQTSVSISLPMFVFAWIMSVEIIVRSVIFVKLIVQQKAPTIFETVEAMKGFIFPKGVVFQTLLSLLVHRTRRSDQTRNISSQVVLPRRSCLDVAGRQFLEMWGSKSVVWSDRRECQWNIPLCCRCEDLLCVDERSPHI